MSRFPIGTQYPDRKGRTCTVTDILTTTDSSGAVVRVRYVAVHAFAGQMVADCDVTETTIARALADRPA